MWEAVNESEREEVRVEDSALSTLLLYLGTADIITRTRELCEVSIVNERKKALVFFILL